MVYATRNVTYKVGKRNLDNRSIQCALVFVATGGVKGSCCFGCGFSLIFPLLFLILQTPSSITCTIRSTLPLLCAYKEEKSFFTLWSPGFLVIGIITTRKCGVSLYKVIHKALWLDYMRKKNIWRPEIHRHDQALKAFKASSRVSFYYSFNPFIRKLFPATWLINRAH